MNNNSNNEQTLLITIGSNLLSNVMNRNSIFHKHHNIDENNYTCSYLENLIDKYTTGLVSIVNRAIVCDNHNVASDIRYIIETKNHNINNINDSRIDILYVDTDATYDNNYSDTNNNNTNNNTNCNIFDLQIRSDNLERINERYSKLTLLKTDSMSFTNMISVLDSMNVIEDKFVNKVDITKNNIVKINIQCYTSIDDVIETLIIDDVKFYTRRQYTKMEKDRFKHVELKILDMTSERSKDKFIKQLKEMDPLENDTVIDDINEVNFSRLPLSTNDEEIITEILKYFNTISDSYTYDMLYKLYVLDMYQSLYDYSSRFDSINNINNTKNIIVVRLEDVNINEEELIEAFKELSHTSTELIYMCGKGFAIGTERVMLYYMTLFRYIGSYKPWKNVRVFNYNGLYSSDIYYNSDRNNYTKHEVQLNEHILHFTDIIVTQIKPLTNYISSRSLTSSLLIYHAGIDDELLEFTNRLRENYTVKLENIDNYNNNNSDNNNINNTNLTWTNVDVSNYNNDNNYNIQYECVRKNNNKPSIHVVSDYDSEYNYIDYITNNGNDNNKLFYVYDVPTMNIDTKIESKTIHLTIVLTDQTINNANDYSALMNRIQIILKFSIVIELYILIKCENTIAKLISTLRKYSLDKHHRIKINTEFNVIKDSIKKTQYLLTDSIYCINYAMYHGVLVNHILYSDITIDSQYDRIDNVVSMLLRLDMSKYKKLIANVLHIIRRDGYSMEENACILGYKPFVELFI